MMKTTAEKWFCGLFCLVSVLLPLLAVEAYPFSLNPMFNYRVRELAVYRVFSPEGEELELEPFGLAPTTCGVTVPNSVHYHRGRVRLQDVNITGAPVVPRRLVERSIRQGLGELDLPWVEVERSLYRARPEGVRLEGRQRFRVERDPR